MAQAYFGGRMNGLGGGYRLSPAGGIGEKSLLTLGSAGGVYFLGSEDKGLALASAFLATLDVPVSPFMYRLICRATKRIAPIQSAMTAASSNR